MRKRGMNGRDSTGGRATHLLLPNMAENPAHTEGGHGLDRGVRTTDTELTCGKHPTASRRTRTYFPTIKLIVKETD